MPKHNNLDVYPFDPLLDPRDGLFGFDFNTGGKSKNFKLEYLRYFVLQGLDASNNGFITINGYSLEDNILTINAGWVWQINGLLCTNEEDIEITLEYTAEGFVRTDSIYVNSDGEFLATSGAESETIAVPPQIPINTLLAFSINVFDNSFELGEEPVLGDIYVKKTFAKDFQFNGTGSNVVIPLNPNGYSDIKLINPALVSISGIDLSLMVDANSQQPYQGKPFIIWNKTGNDITINYDDTSNAVYVFSLIGATNLEFPNGKAIIFYYDGALWEKNKNWFTSDEIIGLQDELDLKLDIADYNDRYKGKYTSLPNLQAAHPTSNDGDTAVVDAGSGTNAIEYIWDSNEGWVQGNSVGATTTDALVEGSTNLYHTAARVLATVLSGLSSSSGTFSSTDSLLTALGKIKYLIDNIASLYVPHTRTLTIGGVTQDLSANRTFAGGSLPKSELYKRHYEVYDQTSGYIFLGSYGSAGLTELNRGSFDFALTAWPYNTPNTVGALALAYFHNTLNIEQQYSETDLTKIKGFYSLIVFKLNNYSSTSQRMLFGLKRDNQAFSNINPSAMTESLFSIGRDSGDSNFSFFIKPNSGTITKMDTGIPYNIQESIILEVERYSGGITGYIKVTTSTTKATFTHNLTDMKNEWAINNGGGINNGATTDVVGFYIFVNKMYKEI